MLSTTAAAEDLHLIKAGTLNDKTLLQPTIQVWCQSQQPWLEISDAIKKYDKTPNM